MVKNKPISSIISSHLNFFYNFSNKSTPENSMLSEGRERGVIYEKDDFYSDIIDYATFNRCMYRCKYT